MANVNLIRRAEIGREKRVKTRAQLVEAANALFAGRAVESVTVDDVVQEAGVAKGTFYTHFDSLEALTAAVAEELVQSFDELLQPGRASITEPALRIAFGCRAFIDKAFNDARWAAVAARMSAANPQSGENIRRHLLEDLQHLSGEPTSAELKLEIVVGIMIHMLRVLGEGRLSSFDPDAVVSAILRAIGLSPQQAGSVLKRLPAAGMEKSLRTTAS